MDFGAHFQFRNVILPLIISVVTATIPSIMVLTVNQLPLATLTVETLLRFITTGQVVQMCFTNIHLGEQLRPRYCLHQDYYSLHLHWLDLSKWHLSMG